MVERSNKPEALSVAHESYSGGTSGVTVECDKVMMCLPSGESAEILLYGATVISWKSGGQERLFLSEKANLDGSKAVRGGIPLVFPIFGKSTEGPTAAMPQHGFARICKWELLGKKTDEGETSIQVDFGLGPENLSVDMKKMWPYTFGLIYSVCLSKGSIETKMLVRNEGSQPFNFNILFHTYLRVPDVTTVNILGLKGVTYKDKVLKGVEATEERDEVTIASEVDRAYSNVPSTVTVVDREKTLFKVERSHLDDVVVWNPWEGSSTMADFGPIDGYKNMLCVEAGTVSKYLSLEPQNLWEGGVVVSL